MPLLSWPPPPLRLPRRPAGRAPALACGLLYTLNPARRLHQARTAKAYHTTRNPSDRAKTSETRSAAKAANPSDQDFREEEERREGVPRARVTRGCLSASEATPSASEWCSSTASPDSKESRIESETRRREAVAEPNLMSCPPGGGAKVGSSRRSENGVVFERFLKSRSILHPREGLRQSGDEEGALRPTAIWGWPAGHSTSSPKFWEGKLVRDKKLRREFTRP